MGSAQAAVVFMSEDQGKMMDSPPRGAAVSRAREGGDFELRQWPLMLPPAPEGPRKKKRFLSPKKLFRDIVMPLTIAFGVALFTQATVAKPYQIPSGSMLPTIQLQDRILAFRLIYHFRPVERGDIVVFEPPENIDPGTPYVKRVIGLPGDTVEVRGGRVLVNGEEFKVDMATTPSYSRATETVPEGMLFVLGDNRNESFDSHRWGYVPLDNVIGRAEFIYWPPEHLKWLGD